MKRTTTLDILVRTLDWHRGQWVDVERRILVKANPEERYRNMARSDHRQP